MRQTRKILLVVGSSMLLLFCIAVAWRSLDLLAGRTEQEFRTLLRDEKRSLNRLVDDFRSAPGFFAVMGSEVLLYPGSERLTYDVSFDSWRTESGKELSEAEVEAQVGTSTDHLRQILSTADRLGFPFVGSHRDREMNFSLVVETRGLLGWGKRSLLFTSKPPPPTGANASATSDPEWFIVAHRRRYSMFDGWQSRGD